MARKANNRKATATAGKKATGKATGKAAPRRKAAPQLPEGVKCSILTAEGVSTADRNRYAAEYAENWQLATEHGKESLNRAAYPFSVLHGNGTYSPDWPPHLKAAKNDHDRLWRFSATGKGQAYRERQKANAAAAAAEAAEAAEKAARAAARKAAPRRKATAGKATAGKAAARKARK